MKLLSAIWLRLLCVMICGFVGLWGTESWAAAPAASPETVFGTELTRANWDLLMRWLNFIILVVLIVKYARQPVILFLKGQRADTARIIEQVEEKKRQAQEKIREGQIQLKASEERLSLIQERIVAEGKRRREQMIADAQAESRMMLSAAQTRIDSHIRDAHETIRTELIDTACEKAMAKLPQLVTEAHQEAMVAAWLNQAQRL